MQKQIKKVLEQLSWLNLIVLFVAGCINAFGVTVFLAPVKLYDSGISGTSMLLAQVTLEKFTLSLFQIAKMRTIVHMIDPKAYMTITEVADVFTSV